MGNLPTNAEFWMEVCRFSVLTHSVVSSLLSGGDFNQWKKENQRTVEVQEEMDGDLQVENPDVVDTLDVVFMNCVFEGNTTTAAQGQPTAVVSASFPDVRLQIYDSIFRNNMYNLTDAQLSGSAVDTGGPITIENTGFLYNEFLKYAPIILVGSQAVLTASGNYVNVIDDEILECDFAIKFQNNVDFEANTNFECIALTAATTNAPATNFGTNHRANRLGTNHRAYGGA
jgi:hypothetical protein